MAHDDPYLWLEEIHGEKASHWINQQNSHSTTFLESVNNVYRS